MPDLTPIHLVIPTHTTRHLEAVLYGVARQTIAPTTLTVTCDVDKPEIESLLQQCAAATNLSIHYVRREHHGVERLAQVRNNAVRSLIARGISDGRILILDGDTFPLAETIEKHARIGGTKYGMVIGHRIMLSEQRTNAINVSRLLTGAETLDPTPEDLEALESLHRNAQRHQMLRKVHLTKPHKPKILGGHFSMRFDVYLAINGCDEEYEVFGTEDDDLGRRAYLSGANSIVAIRDIPVMHLHHPTRAAKKWHDNPNAQRFQDARTPVRATFGIDNPREQHDVRETTFGSGLSSPTL